MNKISRFLLLLSASALPVMLGGCFHDDENTGEMSLALTDAPVDNAIAVVVEFTGVEVQGPGERHSFDFDEPRQIDLLSLTGNASESILVDETLPAGEYQWIRLKVSAARAMTDSYIDLEDGSRHSIYIPSGAETGLKLDSPFVIPAGGSPDFTIDFDLRKSVHNPEDALGDYYLRPSLRLVNNAEVGSIQGTASSTLVTSGCSPVVYLFSGSDVTPDDEDEVAPNPITSAIPTLNGNTGDYDYEIGFVLANDYTITFSCDADIDDPMTDDAMTFTGTQNVTVSVEEVTTVEFQ